MPSPIKSYNPGDKLQASTVSYILRNIGISAQNGASGGGLNAVLQSPTNEQGMADLTDSLIDGVKSHSIIYCLPKLGGGYEWSKTKRNNAQAYYTLGNEAITAISTGNDVVVQTESGSTIEHLASPLENHKMVAVQPMVPGQKYILRSQKDLTAKSVCIWDGERLVETDDPGRAEFFVQKYEWNSTYDTAPDIPLLQNRPRLMNPLLVEHEGYYDVDGNLVSPGLVPDTIRGIYFADNVYPEDGILPGFPTAQDGHVSQINKPMTYKNETELGYAEVVYRPVADSIESTEGQGIIMLPIAPLLTYSDILPRPNGCANRSAVSVVDRGHIIIDYLGDAFSASFLAAKCMGVLAPLDKEPVYMQATYASIDGLDAESSLEIPGYKAEPLFADTETKTVPLYVRRLKVRTDGASNAPLIYQIEITSKVNPFTDEDIPGSSEETNDNGESGSSISTSCGWFRYCYDFSDNSPETVFIPRIPFSAGVFQHADSNGVCHYMLPNTTVITKDRQTPISNYGEWVFKSCDSETGTCKWEFTPDTTLEYNDLGSFPFATGLTLYDRMAVTTQKNRAQVAWYPAISRASDYNETIVPGVTVDYKLESVDLHCRVHAKYIDSDYNEDIDSGKFYDYYVPFQYAVVTPPNVYHTDFEGTPHTKVVKLSIEWPTEEEVCESKIIEEGDYWINNCQYVQGFPTTTNPCEIYFAAIELAENGTPKIREPYGAFNDCENAGNLALFVRRDAHGMTYSCCSRIDYIPFGYAVPTKTPSCFYKATKDENCAPRLKGYVYDVYRQDAELQIKGACYIPCSSLTQL